MERSCSPCTGGRCFGVIHEAASRSSEWPRKACASAALFRTTQRDVMPSEIALSPARASTLRAQGWWRDKTINACFDQVRERWPDKTALVAHTRANEAPWRISYRELDRLLPTGARSF